MPRSNVRALKYGNKNIFYFKRNKMHITADLFFSHDIYPNAT